ncbi:hypothetical protein GOP56_10910 [Brevibacillus sp. 7WMA2]|uniref:hypothetical protein n=1 Tax=Brevibacillus sp. 7WMA2 TaxID=2683193 RepID=UPI0013A75407|nr:hypothetical protein [Brevibacillus sp. 7WMA2]QIC06078.1 hypothetical protein GOP56_10910 [Brevibacillus sp. 7WMA2]
MKKVVLSVLSTALVTSMATSAFAASTGYYLGGVIKKYYGADALVNPEVADIFKKEAFKSSLTQDQILFVNTQGKVASLQDIVNVIDNGQTSKDAFHKATGDDFDKIGGKEGFHTVLDNGTVDAQKKKVPEQDGQPAGDLVVETVNVLSSKAIKVAFSKAVVAVAKENVTVVNKETGQKQYVKTINLSDDKKSATVEFYESLKKGSYTTTVKTGDKSSSKDFNFAIGDVAKIEVQTSQVIPVNKNSKISYKLLDAAGVDVTAENEANVTFEASTKVNPADHTIKLNKDGDIAFVYVSVKKADGTVMKSNKITVKAEDSKPVDLINWSVSPTTVNFTDADYKQNTTVKAGSTDPYVFHVQFKDQFDVKSDYATFVQYESLDKNVALVDRQTGRVTPIKDGTAPVKISIMKNGKTLYSKTVEIKMVSKAAPSKLELKETQVTVSSSLSTTKDVVVNFKDQYGDDIAYTGDLFVKVKFGKELLQPLTEKQAVTDSKNHSITLVPAIGKEGTAVIELSLGDKVKTELTVKVEKAGQVSGFKTDGFEKVLDKNASKKSSMTLKVFSVDDKGVQAKQINKDLFYSVTDATGKVVESGSNADLNIDTTKAIYAIGQEYTVTVKMGANLGSAYQLFSEKFKVINTEELPKVSLTKGTIDIDLSKGNRFADSVQLKDLFEVTFTNANSSDITVDDFTFSSDNTGVIGGTEAINAIVKKDGNATLVIKSVDVTVKGKAHSVKLVPQEMMNVTVNPQAIVTDSVEFNRALQNVYVKTIILNADVTGDFTVNRSVTIKGKDSKKKINGTLTIEKAKENNVNIENIEANQLVSN